MNPQQRAEAALARAVKVVRNIAGATYFWTGRVWSERVEDAILMSPEDARALLRSI